MSTQSKIPILIDNLGDNTLLHALQQLLPFTRALDIATGTFELGSLLALDGGWQPLARIRLLMGDETTRPEKRRSATSSRPRRLTTACSISIT